MFVLPKLPYDYDALNKSISADVMKFHHDMHHQTYVDKFNAALENVPDFSGKSLDYILSNCKGLDEKNRAAVCNNGGGHYNHSLFWQCMSPNGGGQPSDELNKILVQKYGSFQGFIDEFSSRALGVFGSGWAFLMPDGQIITTSNQDTPIMMGLPNPILCLDVWEHAYYLDYQNRRADYIKSWWDVVDWEAVQNRLSNQ